MKYRFLLSAAALSRSAIAPPLQAWVYRCCITLVCAGLLATGTGLLLSHRPAYAHSRLPSMSSPPATAASAQNSATAQISPVVVDRLRQDLSKRTQLPAARLKMIQAIPKTWSNGCLDLARSDEMCSQALVSGWRVTFAYGKQRWVYRTDKQGQNRRLEPAKPSSG